MRVIIILGYYGSQQRAQPLRRLYALSLSELHAYAMICEARGQVLTKDMHFAGGRLAVDILASQSSATHRCNRYVKSVWFSCNSVACNRRRRPRRSSVCSSDSEQCFLIKTDNIEIQENWRSFAYRTNKREIRSFEERVEQFMSICRCE